MRCPLIFTYFMTAQAHPTMTEHERKKLCRVMDCQRLSLEACLHAAQNERLPLRVVVQVHKPEALRFSRILILKDSFADCWFAFFQHCDYKAKWLPPSLLRFFMMWPRRCCSVSKLSSEMQSQETLPREHCATTISWRTAARMLLFGILKSGAKVSFPDQMTRMLQTGSLFTKAGWQHGKTSSTSNKIWRE